jgi:hypothetical protein
VGLAKLTAKSTKLAVRPTRVPNFIKSYCSCEIL